MNLKGCIIPFSVRVALTNYLGLHVTFFLMIVQVQVQVQVHLFIIKSTKKKKHDKSKRKKIQKKDDRTPTKSNARKAWTPFTMNAKIY